ncbi:MAG: acetyl-CoA C-acyltransferase [Candidatus Limnocylindrales bacterium]
MSRELVRPVHEAWIVEAVRTPIGRFGGALARVRPDDLAALVVGAAVERSAIDSAAVDDVILGNANGAGEDNRNVGRMAALLAGLPVEVAGQTVNRLCGSGLQAVNSAAHAIMAGDAELIVAGGVESMSRAPIVELRPDPDDPEAPPQRADSKLGWRFVNPRMDEAYPVVSLGETAEIVAQRYGISREEQDAFAAESQARAAAAIEAGRFDDQLVPVPVRQPDGSTVMVARDEHPRPGTTTELLAGLRPAFREDGTGTVTAGNASGINDGAAALVLAEAERARSLGLVPLARIVSTAVAGVDPSVMGMGPVPATRKALARAGIGIDQLDLIELNEAFASQSVACLRELGLDPARVNVNGGAIALGHPLGMSGARLMTMLVHELRARGARYGLATMCIGVGQGIATIVETVTGDQ